MELDILLVPFGPALCDPIWQVALRSCEMVFHEQLYQLYLYLYLYRSPEAVGCSA